MQERDCVSGSREVFLFRSDARAPRRLLFGSLTSRLSDLAVGTERRRVASRVSWIPEIYRMIL